jgi:DNA-binding MarR family transcriptional regulator
VRDDFGNDLRSLVASGICVYDAPIVSNDDHLLQALLRLTGFLNRPSADAALLRQADSSLDRALFPLLIWAELGVSTTLSELADTVGRHYTTVSRQVTALERQGLVRRDVNPNDRRHALVMVTDKGHAEAARIAGARNELFGEIFADWVGEDKADLTRLLSKLVASMEVVSAKIKEKGGLT